METKECNIEFTSKEFDLLISCINQKIHYYRKMKGKSTIIVKDPKSKINELGKLRRKLQIEKRKVDPKLETINIYL
jgi:hypothetical protein